MYFKCKFFWQIKILFGWSRLLEKKSLIEFDNVKYPLVLASSLTSVSNGTSISVVRHQLYPCSLKCLAQKMKNFKYWYRTYFHIKKICCTQDWNKITRQMNCSWNTRYLLFLVTNIVSGCTHRYFDRHVYISDGLKCPDNRAVEHYTAIVLVINPMHDPVHACTHLWILCKIRLS